MGLYAIYERWWKKDRLRAVKAMLKEQQALWQEQERLFPDGFKGTRTGELIQQLKDLVARCEKYVHQEWENRSKKEILKWTQEVRKEIKVLKQEQKKDMREIQQEKRGLASLMSDYDSWTERLNTLRERSKKPFSVRISIKNSPELEEERQELIREQEKLVQRGKELNVEAVYDADGWLTG